MRQTVWHPPKHTHIPQFTTYTQRPLATKIINTSQPVFFNKSQMQGVKVRWSIQICITKSNDNISRWMSVLRQKSVILSKSSRFLDGKRTKLFSILSFLVVCASVVEKAVVITSFIAVQIDSGRTLSGHRSYCIRQEALRCFQFLIIIIRKFVTCSIILIKY